MAGSFSDFLENELLDHVFGSADYTPPATVYVALYTTAPSDSGGGVEVSAGGYARVAVANNATQFPAASGGQKSNGQAITFPVATGDWGTVVAFALLDASTSGNFLGWATLGTSKTINTGQAAQFPPSSLVITLD